MLINTDGSSVGAASFDGQPVRQITINGNMTWTSPVVEAFEAGNLDAYSPPSYTDSWSLVQSPTPVNGQYALKPDTEFTPIHDVDRVNGPGPGDKFSVYVYLTDGSATSHGPWIHFGMQSDTDFYQLRCRGGSNTQLYRQTDSDQQWLHGGLFSYESNAWNRIDITWDDGSTFGGADGEITIEGFDSSGNPIGTISATDTTHGQGGIGFNSELATGEDAYIDYVNHNDVVALNEPEDIVIEDFESGDFTEYSGSTETWYTTDYPAPYHGGEAAYTSSSFSHIYDLDHAESPAPGDQFSVYVYLTDGSATSHGPWFHFGMQNSTDFYQLRCRGGSNTQLYEQSSGGQTWLDGDVINFESNAWNRLDITWDDGTLGGSNGDITVQGYDSDGDPIGGISGNSTTYGAGGIGFSADLASGEDAYIDYVVKPAEFGQSTGGDSELPSNVSDMSLTFEDTFDQASFDDNPYWEAGWGWGYGAPGSSPSRVDVPGLSNLRDHVAINNGKLILTADKDHWDSDGELHVGAVHSNPSGYDAPSTGIEVEPPVYFEAKMKGIGGDGWQNAFWTKPSNEDWPPEIDVMELLQNGSASDWTSHNLHYSTSGNCGDGSTHDTYNGSYSGYTSGDYPYQTFHTYGFEWRNDVMRHYVDGFMVEEVTDSSILSAFDNSSCLPHYLMLSMNLDNVGTTDKSVSWSDKQIEIEHVRVYKP